MSKGVSATSGYAFFLCQRGEEQISIDKETGV